MFLRRRGYPPAQRLTIMHVWGCTYGAKKLFNLWLQIGSTYGAAGGVAALFVYDLPIITGAFWSKNYRMKK